MAARIIGCHRERGAIMGVLDRLLNQDNFTEAFDKLQENYKRLVSEYETQKAVNKELAEDYVRLEQKVNILKFDPEQYIKAELEKRTLELKKQYEEAMQHKWYCIGRQDAYAEMGIRSIEAHEHGNILIQLPNGDIVEQILGLEDINYEHATLVDIKEPLKDEIIIDDLAEV